MSTRLGKHYGGRFNYLVFNKEEDNKWHYFGKYSNYTEASEDTGLSVHSFSCLVNGIHTGCQDNWKVKTEIRGKKCD